MTDDNKPDDGTPEGKKQELTDLEKAQAEVEKWKALSRKNEAQARENADKAKKFDELEEQSKSELEKAIARAEAAEKKLAEREAQEQAAALAKEVAKAKAKEKGITDAAQIANLADALHGMTQEELEAHADKLLALIPDKPNGATGGTGGDRGDDIDEDEADAKEIAANVRVETPAPTPPLTAVYIRQERTA